MLKKFLTIAICLLFLSSIADAWLDGYAKRKQGTVQGTNLGSNQTHFPVFMKLVDSDIDDECDDDGDRSYDIRFTQSDDTVLDVDWLDYSEAGGNATIICFISDAGWTINADGSTTFYIYYGNAAAGDPGTDAGVWDSNFIAVYHLDESAGNAIDITGNGHTGTFNGGLPDQQTGQLYLCQDLTATGDYVETAATTDFGVTSITAEAWAKTDLVGDGGAHAADTVVQKYGASNLGWKLGVDDSGLPVWLYYGDAGSCIDDVITSSGASVVGSWHYLVGTRSTSGLELFVDAVSRGTDTQTCAHATDSVPLFIGRWKAATAAADFDGRIEEVRISDIVRVDDWIEFAFYNESEADNELTWGSEQSPPADGNAIFFGINFSLIRGIY